MASSSQGSSPTGVTNSIAHREQGLRRELSSAQISMIAIGGAIGTGLFLGSSFAISFAGPAVLLSYVIAGLIALILMACLAEMTVTHPATGSFGAHAELYLGRRAGFLLRYSYWAAVVLAIGTEVAAVAVYMRFWYPGLPGWIWIVGFSTILLIANALHVKVFGTIEYLFSALKIISIVVFILLGAWVVLTTPHGPAQALGNLHRDGGFLPHGVSGMWAAVVVAIFSYFSLEMIAVAAGEAREPGPAIERAFRGTLLRLVLFYLLSLAMTLAIVPWRSAGAGGSPFVRVMAATHVPAAAGIVNLIILIAALSAMNSQLYITARMMFSLARAGDAPAALGRLSRRGVPVAALLLSSAGIAVATLFTILWPATAFLLMVSISVFGGMFTWLMIFVTHLAFRRQYAGPSPSFRLWGAPFTNALGAVAMAALLLTTPFVAAFRLTLICGLPFLGLLLLVDRLRSRGAVTTRGLGPSPHARETQSRPPDDAVSLQEPL